MKTISGMVLEFHQTYDVPILAAPGFPPAHRRTLRWNLLNEEHTETKVADEENDIVEFADGLGDMVYIIYGTALEHGIDLDAVLVEIHRANMSKLGEDGQPIRRADGKVLKGPNYIPPDIPDVLRPARSEVIEYISLEEHQAILAEQVKADDARVHQLQADHAAAMEEFRTRIHAQAGVENIALKGEVIALRGEIAALNGKLVHHITAGGEEYKAVPGDGR